MDIADLISDFVCSQLLERRAAVRPDTSLFEGKVLDSMKLVELIGFIEDRFSIRVEPMDITVENLDTVARMAEYIRRKQA